MVARHFAKTPCDALLGLCGLLLIAIALGGCVSKSKADAEARKAFIAGQQQAVVRMQQVQGPSVIVIGEVRNRVIPWNEGLTLAQTIVAAEYLGVKDPGQIVIVHNGVATRLDPKQLMSGTDIPLQPGDIVQLLSQAPPQKP